MKFETKLQNAIAGDQKSLEFMMRQLSKSSWRVSKKELTNEQLHHIVSISDNVIVKNPQNANALFMRGLVFQYQDKKYDMAKKLYEDAAALQHLLAKTRLAYLHILGVGGIECNLDKALQLCQQGIDAEDSETFYIAGCIYEKKQQYTDAIFYLEKAIAHNHASAMFIRASFYASGIGGDKDPIAAARLYEQAIKLNHTLAMSHCAQLYFSEPNETTYMVTAAKLLRRAVKDKHNRHHAIQVLESVATVLNTEVAYNAAAALYLVNNSKYLLSFMISHCYEFIFYLHKDEFLSLSDKVKLFDLMRETLGIQKINPIDIPSFKIMCECYIVAAERQLKKNKIEKALELYSKIPIAPSLHEVNGNVFCKMGLLIYKQAMNEQNTQLAALEIARFYFEKGIEIKNKECEKEYSALLKEILRKEYSSMAEYQSAYKDFKAQIPSEKLALDIFIAKYHLHNFDYWRQFTKKHKPVQVASTGNTFAIPSKIKDIYDIALNPDKNEVEKIKEIQSKFNTGITFFKNLTAKFFDSDDMVNQCLRDAAKLSPHKTTNG